MSLGRLMSSLVLYSIVLAFGPRSALAAGPSGINVLQNETRVDFPRQVDFHVVAESTAQVTTARLAFRIGDQTQTHIGAAPIDPVSRVDVHYVLELQREYLPPGVDLHFRWLLEDQSGAQASTAWSDLTLTDSRFRWSSLTVAPVQLEWYDVDDAFAKAVLDAANAAYSSASQVAPTSGATRAVKILLYGDINDFRGALGAGSQEWVGGQTFPQDRITLLLVSPGDLPGAQRSVAHEMAHLGLDAAADGSVAPLPSWLDEGLAMVAEGPTESVFSQALDQAVRDHKLFSIQSLSGNFPESTADATLAYAQSENLVRFFIKKYGANKLSVLVGSFRAGLSADDAFRQSIGMSAHEFQAAWQASLTATPTTSPTAPTGSPITRAIAAQAQAFAAFFEGLIHSLQSPKAKTT